MFVTLALLGLSRSEALGLRWEDVDLVVGTMQIRRGLHRIEGKLQVMPTKTERSQRTIPLPAPVLSALRTHLSSQERERGQLGSRWPDTGFVFTTPIGTPIDPDNCSKLVRACSSRPVSGSFACTTSDTGAYPCSWASGVPPRTVMEIAGHSALEMTMNVYAHVSLDDKRQALDKLGDLFEEEAE